MCTTVHVSSIYEYGRHVSDPASTGPRSRQRVHLDTGFTGENYVSTGAVIGFTGKNHIKVAYKLTLRNPRKLTIKNLPTKIAMVTLKTQCDSLG